MRYLYPIFFLMSLSAGLLAQQDQPTSFGKGSATVLTHSRPFKPATAKVFDEDLAPFLHGVASGDPLEDRVIIWTRVTPDDPNGGAVEVDWTVATDPELAKIVTSGTTVASPEADFTVKVDVTGLQANTTYYYGFSALSANSLTGRTKTIPSGNEADHLRFGVVSCSNYQAGYFGAYGGLARRNDLDAIVHLGDYIYEYGNFVYGSDSIWQQRTVEPATEIVTLFDYRNRYATYRLDTNLLRLHQQHPMIAVWDDHESANDAWENGAENHDPATEGDWEDRKGNARRAYFEWMPIRESEDERVYRTIRYGDLADLIMLDTRLEGRDQQINDIEDPTLYAPDRTILGTDQKAWLLSELENSTARWKIIGQQVIFSEFNVGWAASATGGSFQQTESLFLDIWDGYPAERQQLIEYLETNDIDNVVVLTGDFHSSFAFDVAAQPVDLQFRDVPGAGTLPFYDPSSDYVPTSGEGAVAVEFATPSINSANFDENTGLETAQGLQYQINRPLQPAPGLNLGNPNPHMKFAELIRHGYYILDVRDDTTQADYFFNPILADTIAEAFGGGFFTALNQNHLDTAGVQAAGKVVQDSPAPTTPPQYTNATVNPNRIPGFRIMALYPNPAGDHVYLSYGLNQSTQLTIHLTDNGGRILRTLDKGRKPAGLYTLFTDLADLPVGTYYFRVATPAGVTVQAFVKQ